MRLDYHRNELKALRGKVSAAERYVPRFEGTVECAKRQAPRKDIDVCNTLSVHVAGPFKRAKVKDGRPSMEMKYSISW